MNVRFNVNSLNIAPKAPPHCPLAWVVLSTCLAAFCGSLLPLCSSIREVDHLNQRKEELQRIRVALDGKIQRERVKDDSPALRKRYRTNSEFQARVKGSWNGVFDSLEIATHTVQGGASIVSMSPKIFSPETAAVEFAAVAAGAPVMLAYLTALREDYRVREVELLTHQPDPKSGPEAIRFQFVVSFDPSDIIPKSALAQTRSGAGESGTVALSATKGLKTP